MRRYMMVMMAALFTLAAVAQQRNRIYIENFEIYPDSSLTVPVMLANMDSTRGIQFNITLPSGLRISECNLTPYADEYDMNLFQQSNAGVLTIGMYPFSRVCLPPDTVAVMTIDFKAMADFKGGELFLWKCRGSTMENMSIIIGDDTTTVTVPSSSLIGIPIDQKTNDELYFNLLGQPIPSPDSVPVAVQVTTRPDGTISSRKVAKRP